MEEIRQDYFEMMFHHTLVFALLIPVYLCHFHRASLPILIMMDLPDAVTNFVRCVVETHFHKLTVAGAYSMVFSWLYFRIIAYGYYIHQIIYSAPANVFHGRDFKAIKVLGFLLVLLWFLNAYWLYLMVSALLRYKKQGVLKDDAHENAHRKKDQ